MLGMFFYWDTVYNTTDNVCTNLSQSLQHGIKQLVCKKQTVISWSVIIQKGVKRVCRPTEMVTRGPFVTDCISFVITILAV